MTSDQANLKALLHGLQELKKTEQRTSDYYRVAADEAEQRNNLSTAQMYREFREAHGDLAIRFDDRRRELEENDDDGKFGETLHSFGEAIRSVIADMPVLFIQQNTHLTPSSMIRMEEELAALYRALLDSADDETKRVINYAIATSERTIEHLSGRA